MLLFYKKTESNVVDFHALILARETLRQRSDETVVTQTQRWSLK